MTSESKRHGLSSEEELPIVLLHGTSGESEDWSRVVEQIAPNIRVIRPNYFKQTAANGRADAPTIADLAIRVVNAVRADGAARFDLVGNSLGAAVATFVAAEYPEMVRSLVLISGFSDGSDPRMRLQFDLWLRLVRTDKVAMTKLLLMSGLSPEFLSVFDEPTLDGIIAAFVASSDWSLIEEAVRVDLGLNVRAEAQKIKAPTLLIAGKYDQIVPPAYSEDLASLISNSQKVEISSGHLSFLEKPLDLASTILRFFKEGHGLET